MKVQVAAFVLFATASLATPPPEITFTFDCSKPNGKGARETCNTMCFGLKCHNIPNYFNFDDPDQETKDERREKAGCGRNNRCSKDPYGSGFECDEFPFAMSSQGSAGGQINRCVPDQPDHKSQGAQILQIQTNKKYCNKRPGCVFHLSFTNEGDYKYCKKDPDCTPDDNLYTKDGPITSGVARRASEGGRYMLASGKTIFSPSDLKIGTLSLRHEAVNVTLERELMARGVFDDEYDNNMEIVEDEVIAKL